MLSAYQLSFGRPQGISSVILEGLNSRRLSEHYGYISAKNSFTFSLFGALLVVVAINFFLLVLHMAGEVFFALMRPDHSAKQLSKMRSEDDFVELGLSVFLFFTALYIGIVAWRRALQSFRRDAESLLKVDDRPPILLLRSFADDRKSVLSNNWFSQVIFRRLRLEEVLNDELKRFGPFISVGVPNEKLAPLGAYRAYLSDDEWQTSVLSWITQSRIVVAVVGTTRWLRWEAERIVEQGALNKTIFVLPPGSMEDRAIRWNSTIAALQGTKWGAAAKELDIERAYAVVFGPEGEAIVIGGQGRSRQSHYQMALRVGLYALGNAWQSKIVQQENSSGVS